MKKIRLLSVGKTKEDWLKQAMEMYIKRLQSIATFESIWAKNDAQLVKLSQNTPYNIALDAAGMVHTSEGFSNWFLQLPETVTFIIGGAEGLPASLHNVKGTLSLSRMTYTHQICRLILVEQIYRAFEIDKGSPYHK